MRDLESKVEFSMSQIASLKLERKRHGESGKDTRSIQKKLKKEIQTAKDHIAMWKGWHALFQSSSYKEPNIDEDNLFTDEDREGDGRDSLPWTAAQMDHAGGFLQLQNSQIVNELARTQEELRFLKGDVACFLRSLYKHIEILKRLSSGEICNGEVHLLKARLRKATSQYVNARELFRINGLL